MSDIRVSVQWENPTVFAGEDVTCTITFKNVAQARSIPRSSSPNPHTASHGSHRERWKEILPSRSSSAPKSAIHRKSPSSSGLSQPHARTHKQTSSLSSANVLSGSPILDVHDDSSKYSSPGNDKHRRSVSIVSICGEANGETSPYDHSGRPGHVHTRATSLHVMPRRNGRLSCGPSSGTSHSTYFTTC